MRTTHLLLLASTSLAWSIASFAAAVPADVPAADVPAADTPGADAGDLGEIVVTSHRTRSVAEISSVEIQKVLPGISPLKALQTLPGVTI